MGSWARKTGCRRALRPRFETGTDLESRRGPGYRDRRVEAITAYPTQTTTYTVTATGSGCNYGQASDDRHGAASRYAALPPNNPDPNTERNWTFERSYDGNGNVVAESKQFTDGLGRATQAQARNAATQQVFAAQTIYNSGGQPVLQTLAAPTNNQSFNYKEDFVTVGGKVRWTTPTLKTWQSQQSRPGRRDEPRNAGLLLQPAECSGAADAPHQLPLQSERAVPGTPRRYAPGGRTGGRVAHGQGARSQGARLSPAQGV